MLTASYFAFLPVCFGFKTFGTINGLVSVLTACVGLLKSVRMPVVL
jgi:hypothetical protein